MSSISGLRPWETAESAVLWHMAGNAIHVAAIATRTCMGFRASISRESSDGQTGGLRLPGYGLMQYSDQTPITVARQSSRSSLSGSHVAAMGAWIDSYCIALQALRYK